MSFSFRRDLSQLANLKSSEFLSTEAGLTGTPILNGALYKHYALKGLLGGTVQCDAAEKEAIKSIVEKFLEEAEKNGFFETTDLPLLTTVDSIMKRMVGAEKSQKIHEIYTRIWERFIQQLNQPKDQERAPIVAAPIIQNPLPDTIHPAPLQQPATLITYSIEQLAPSAYSPPKDQLASVIQPIFGPLLPSKTETSPEIQTISASHSPSAIQTPPLQQTLPAGETFSLEECNETLRSINTSWFLNTPVLDGTRTDCEKIKDLLYKKSLSQSALSKEEWIMLARSLILLLRETPDEATVKMAQEIFLRFYLKEQKPSALPEEFLALFKILSKDSFVREKILFFQSSPVPLTTGTPEDPNALFALQILTEQFTAFRWEDNPITITGFTSAQPWRKENDKRTDQKIISDLCQTIDTTTLKDTLDTVTLILLFALSSHTFRENPSFKKDFRRLAKYFPELMKTLRENPPKTPEDTLRYNNFYRLYQFFIGSRFLTRIEEEGRSKSSEEKQEAPTVALGERFSLWGFKEIGSRELAGNLKQNFDMPMLLTSLNEARQVALRELKAKKQTRKLPVGEHFTQLPGTRYPLSRPGSQFSWGELFHEPIDDPKKTWEQNQAVALARAQEISASFQKKQPPLNFEEVVSVAQKGGDALKKLLDTYEDGGLTLLRDYVYPYVVLLKYAQTPFEHIAAKFIRCAASPEEIASLGGEDPETIVAVLKNALCIMRAASDEDKGGFLKDSVIQSNQVEMLSKMIRCIESNKTIFIWNETGSGKTTMSKLAPEIVSLPVPMVLHVAPFTQAESEWERLTSWNMLSSLKKGQTKHFWITASDLSKLMEKGIPQKHQQILRKTFFLFDEYDSQSYAFTAEDASGAKTPSSIQDELFFQYGCSRVVNMSATPNLETIDNMIAHYRKKMDEIIKSSGSRTLVDYYMKKIFLLEKSKEELLANITREWQRDIELKSLREHSTSHEQINAVFHDIQQFEFDTTNGASLLVEMPEFTLSPDFTHVLEQKMQETFGEKPSALLFRDSDGFVQAHFTQDGKTWISCPVEEFTKIYRSSMEKPTIVCFYAQDSVGGDFGIFSNERLVKGQFIVYPGDIAPSYSIFQNMRRQRTNTSSQGAQKSRAPSRTPVRFYLSPKASTLLEPSAEEKARIEALPKEEQASALNLLRKEKLIEKATATAVEFSQIRESARLKKKIIRKKQHLLTELLKIDAHAFSLALEEKLKDLPSKETILSFFNSKILSLIEETPISLHSQVEDLRRSILKQALSSINEPAFEHMAKDPAIQENEALVALLEVFGGADGLATIAESADPYEKIHKLMANFYGTRPASCTELFTPAIQAASKKKKSPILHPVVSSDAVIAALQRLRGKAPEGIVGVNEAIEPSPVRPGFKPLPPDMMVKAFLGLGLHDKIGAKRFCQRFQKEAEKALAYQAGQQALLKERLALIESTKQDLLRDIETLSPRMSPLASLALENPKILTKAQQLDLYTDTYRLYSQQKNKET